MGPKGRIERVRVLGPTRKYSQVEIAMTEQFNLGVGTLTLWAVLFEIAFPHFAGRGVGDPLGLVAYASCSAAREFRLGPCIIAAPPQHLPEEPMPAQSFDLIVIGGGPAGICGANTAGVFGKRVALMFYFIPATAH